MRLGDHPQLTLRITFTVPGPALSALYVHVSYNVTYVTKQVKAGVWRKGSGFSEKQGHGANGRKGLSMT